MNIGMRIKELRKDHRITQDKLSEYLGVSPQAISKWENGTTMPDITFLPTLSEIFKVSTDYLLGIEYDVTDGKTAEYQRKYRELQANGDVKGRCELMRKALIEYPRNYEFMNNLARSLPHISNSTEDYQEIICLCKHIIAGCKDDALRYSAIQTICRAYHYIGENEKAFEYANLLPSWKYAKENAFAWISNGETKNMIIESNTLELLIYLATKMLARVGRWSGRRATIDNVNLSFDEELYVYNTVLSLLKLPFTDEKYYMVDGKIAQVHRFISRLYARNGDGENALNHLRLSEHHAEMFETNKNKGLKYTSIFFDKLQFECIGTRHGDSNEYGRILRKIRQWDCFDFIRNTPEFIEFEKRIEKKANEN